MNLRLQTLSQDTSEVLNEALRTVQSMARVMREKFVQASQEQ